jgi:hypothetical protein
VANNISVSITADVADLTAKRAILSAELKAATADLNTFARTASTSGMTSELRSSMLASAEAVARLKAQVVGVTAEIKTMGAGSASGFSGIVAGSKNAAASITAFREAIAGIGQAMIAAFAVKEILDFAEGMAKTAEETYQTAVTFGLTTAQVQRLKAEAAGAGVSFDAVSSGMMRLDRSAAAAIRGTKLQSEAFKQIGVDVKEPMTQMQLWEKTLQGFGNMADGPAKVAAEMAVFGRNIQGIAQILALTADEQKNLNDAIEASGAVNDTAEQKGLALAHAFNTQKIEMMGLGNVMMDALAPALTAIIGGLNKLIEGFVQSYIHGGIAKTIMDALAGVLKVLATAFILTAQAVSFTIAPFVALYHGIAAVVDIIRGDMPGAAAQGKAALDAIADSARSAASALAAMKAVWGGGALPALPKAGKGTTADDLLGTPKHKKHKKIPEEDALTKLKEQLDGVENAHNDTIQDMTAVELAFWQKVAAGPQMQTLNAKQQAEVRMTILRLEHQEAMKGIAEELAADKDAGAQKIAAVQEQASKTRAALEQQVKAIQAGEDRGEITRPDATASIEAAYAQERQIATDAADAIYQITVETQEKIKAKADQTTDQYRAAQKAEVDAKIARDKAIISADDSFNAQMQAQSEAAATKFKQQWDSVVDPLVHSFTSGLAEMAEGTKTFGQAIKGVAQQILNDMLGVIDRVVEQWLWSEIRKTLASLAGNAQRAAASTAAAAAGAGAERAADQGTIAHDAGIAAANTYKAISAIPVIGPFLAPPAAAAAFAAVEAFGASGGFDIGDFAPMTQLHPREMVLPRALAERVRNMTTNNSSRGGDSHVTLNHAPNITNPDRDIVKALEGSKADFARLLKGMHRDGHFPGAR